MQEARVRDEYVWPYSTVRAGVWYAASFKPTDEPGWFWVHTRPMPTFALQEHFELRDARSDGTSHAPRDNRVATHASSDLQEVAEREVRLRSSALRRYGGVLPGIWMRARDLIALLRPTSHSLPGERRRQRLPAADFEFRTNQPQGPRVQGIDETPTQALPTHDG